MGALGAPWVLDTLPAWSTSGLLVAWLTSKNFLVEATVTLLNVSLSRSSTNLSPYTLSASCSQRRTRSSGVFRISAVENRSPWPGRGPSVSPCCVRPLPRRGALWQLRAKGTSDRQERVPEAGEAWGPSSQDKARGFVL